MKLKKCNIEIQILLDSGSKINIMIPAYATKLRLRVHPTDVRALKINRFMLLTYVIVLANF